MMTVWTRLIASLRKLTSCVMRVMMVVIARDWCTLAAPVILDGSELASACVF